MLGMRSSLAKATQVMSTELIFEFNSNRSVVCALLFFSIVSYIVADTIGTLFRFLLITFTPCGCIATNFCVLLPKNLHWQRFLEDYL